MACRCPVHAARGKPVHVERKERLRGYEIELSSRQVDALRDPRKCKGHSKKCGKGGRCSLRFDDGAGKDCNCIACQVESGKAKDPWECPGHPCCESGETHRYLKDLVVTGARGGYAVQGGFDRHRNTPKDNDFWDLKTDGSCGFELVTPPMSGEEVPEVLGPVLRKLNESEKLHKTSFIDNHCGLHVTFDVNSVGTRGLKRILFTTLRHQEALVGTQPAYRKNNQFCKPIKPQNGLKKGIAGTVGLEQLKRAGHNIGLDGKYYLINLGKAFNGGGLIEFRFGGATTDAKVMDAFGILCECLIDAALTRPKVTTLKDIKERFFEEIIKPFLSDRRVKRAWESVLYPQLAKVTLR